MSDYPEHDKLQAFAEESQTIGEFLDTMLYKLCVFGPVPVGEEPCPYSKEHWNSQPWKDAEGDRWQCVKGRWVLSREVYRRFRRNLPVLAEEDEDRWCVRCKGQGYITIMGDRWSPVRLSIEQVLAEHFGIDTKKLDAEKHQMLAVIRENYGKDA